jgi:hypothetical protein
LKSVVDVHPVAQPARVVADLPPGTQDLPAGARVHEHEVRPLGVDVLELALLDVGGLELLARFVRALEHRAGGHVADLDPRESLALAGLHELEVDDHVRLVVDHHFQAFSDVARVHGGGFLVA